MIDDWWTLFLVDVEASTDATIELSDSLLILLLVVPSPLSMLLPTTSSEISYTLAESSNEFKNENQEHHDFRNVFNAQMQAVAKRNCMNITGKE